MTRFCLPILVTTILGGAMITPANAQGSFEDQVLAQLNYARANPSSYAQSLKRYRGFYHAKLVVMPDSPVDYETEEGVAPVDEAIAFLESQDRRPSFLAGGSALAEAALDHGIEQAADGATGHVGRDGTTPGERVRRRGGGIHVGEMITYGSENAEDVVRQLIVDDGVPDRGHRNLLFAPGFRYAGIFCGPHPTYRMMCVIDIARTPDARPSRQMASLD